MDIDQLICSTDLYNLHGHTPFCDGHAPMEDFVLEAISEFFSCYGFSPHAPTTVESPCNMSRTDMDSYLTEVRRLQVTYGHQIKILAGLEIDYMDALGPNDPYFRALPVDYRIGSVHFIPSAQNDTEMVDIDGRYSKFKTKMATHFDGDIEWVVRTYFGQMSKMVEQGGFDIVGHLDKIGLNASQYRPGIDDEPWYDRLVLQLIEAIMDCGLVIEVNTKAWLEHNRFFPHLKYFGLLKRYGARVVFSSDAHYPTLINSGREQAMRLYRLA